LYTRGGDLWSYNETNRKGRPLTKLNKTRKKLAIVKQEVMVVVDAVAVVAAFMLLLS